MPLARQQTKSEHPEATELYRKLIETYRVEHPDADTSRIEAAFQLALQAHKDVERETECRPHLRATPHGRGIHHYRVAA